MNPLNVSHFSLLVDFEPDFISFQLNTCELWDEEMYWIIEEILG